MEMRATACWKLAMWDEADALFDQQFKGRAKLMETLGIEAFGRGKRRSARRILNKHFEGRESIMELLADSYVKDEKWDEAKSLLTELLQDETDQQVRLRRMHTLSTVCFAQNHIAEAETWCLKALLGRPSKEQFHELISLLAQMYNPDRAEIYSVLMDLSPGLQGTSQDVLIENALK
jgi:hypothetical protein